MAIARIKRSLERAFADGSNTEAREDMMFASLCAGIAFSHAGTASAHALQYPVGAATHTAHGLGVALLLPFVLENARPDVDGALEDIADILGLQVDSHDRPGAAIDELDRLVHAVGVPRSLAEIGVTATDIPEFARDAIGITRLVRNAPRSQTEDDYVQILEAAQLGNRLGARAH
jgi:alcohol dehydrogenase